MKKYLLFDLDGTLTDPKIGITTCVQYALHSFGIEEPDLDKLEPFIGPPLRDSFMEFYGFTAEQAEEAVAKYRERFQDTGLFENEVPVESITVMVQKEAGTRLCAPMGTRDMGAVTVAINYFSVPKLLFNVSRGSFMPSPNVDSCVVRFDIRDKTPEGVTDEKFFFKVARGAFSQRRKTLSNSVSSSMGIDKSIVNQAIEQSDLPASVRPEALSMEQFITFSEALRKLI